MTESEKTPKVKRKLFDKLNKLSEKIRKRKRGSEDYYRLPRRRWIIRVLIIVAIVAAGVIYLSTLMDNSYFETDFFTVSDQGLEPVRIVLLSDLHEAEFGKNNTDLVTRVRRLAPDIIAITGDMVNQDDPDESVVIELCRQLVEIAPVYYSYGNSELYLIRVEESSDLDVKLSELGVNVLHNDFVTVEVNGNLLDIGGLDVSPQYFEEPYVTRFWERYMESENYRLLLCHYPNYFMDGGPLENANAVDMALCGHLHGGQIILPRVGGLYHPSTGFFPELEEKVNYVGDTVVVTSRGLGNHSIIPRVNNVPEVVVIDIK